jgi:hypothetical protein
MTDHENDMLLNPSQAQQLEILLQNAGVQVKKSQTDIEALADRIANDALTADEKTALFTMLVHDAEPYDANEPE